VIHEECISDLEDKIVEFTPSEQKKKRHFKRSVGKDKYSHCRGPRKREREGD